MNESKPSARFMNTSKNKKCLRCGAPIPAASADQLCPACLMSGAVKARNSEQRTLRITAAHPPSRPEAEPFPREFGGCRDCSGAAAWGPFTRLNNSPPGVALR